MNTPANPPRPLGIIVNPASGRDTRRLFARAMSSTNESKRNQVERLIVGAAAGGATRIVLARDAFRIAAAAAEAIGVDVEIQVRDVAPRCHPNDTVRSLQMLIDEGCGAIAVLGGDGTSRILAKAGCALPILPLSTGTNNVFPVMIEATVAGTALGLVASGRVPIEEAGQPCKVVRVAIDGGPDDLALIDAVHMVGDHIGSLLPFDPKFMRTLVLSRALPWAVGTSPIGGLLHPCLAEDDFGVRVLCAPEDVDRRLLAPISPGLFRPVGIRSAGRLRLDEVVEIEGPGFLAFDGDRERPLAEGQRAWLRVSRDGPPVIDVRRTLASAARRGVFEGDVHWHDHRDEAGLDCC